MPNVFVTIFEAAKRNRSAKISCITYSIIILIKNKGCAPTNMGNSDVKGLVTDQILLANPVTPDFTLSTTIQYHLG